MAQPVRTRFLGSVSNFDPAANQLILTVVNPPTATQSSSGLTVLMIVFADNATPVTIASISDTKGNSYLVDGSFSPPTPANGVGFLVRSSGAKALAAGDAITITFSASTSSVAEAEEYDGALYPGVSDGTASATGSTSSPDSGGLATTFANDLLLGIVGFNPTVGGSLSAGAGWTVGTTILSPNQPIQITTLWRGTTTTGTYDANGTTASSVNWYASIVSYKAANPKGAAVGVAVAKASYASRITAKAVGVALAKGVVPAIGKAIGVALAKGVVTAKTFVKAVAVGVASVRGGQLFSLWNDLGLLIGRISNYGVLGNTNLDADLTKITTKYYAKNDLEGLYGTYTGIVNTVTSWRQALASYAEVRLSDQVRVQNELRLVGANVDTILDSLAKRMLEMGATIKQSTVTIGSVYGGRFNAGDGVLLTTKVLDGVSAPLAGATPHLYYDGLNSELAVPGETMTLVCTADSENGGATEGQESFSWTGFPTVDDMSWRPEGSGTGPTISVAGGGVGVVTGDFETWVDDGTGTGNVIPSGWTVDSGVAGTHILQATSTFFRGSSSLKFMGDGSTTIQLSWPLSGNITPHQRYALAFRLTSDGQPAGGTLTVGFSGTGYTAAGSERVVLTTDSLPAFWTLENVWINMPNLIPSDFKLILQVTTAPGIGIYFDDVILKPVDYHGGIGLVLIPGRQRFIENDRFEFAVSNDGAGLFQSFFRQRWQTQLPSAGAPSIVDALAQ